MDKYDKLSTSGKVEFHLNRAKRIECWIGRLKLWSKKHSDKATDLTKSIASEAYATKGRPTGLARVSIDGLKLVFDRSETVKWDQAALQDLADEMAAQGADPLEYMGRKKQWVVSAAAYNNWPKWIKDKFRPARTVSKVTTKITIEGD